MVIVVVELWTVDNEKCFFSVNFPPSSHSKDLNGKVLFRTFVGGELSAGVLKLYIDLLAAYNPFALALLKFRSVINC